MSDAEGVYCEENLLLHANDSGALALLPAKDGQIVKVNFWTFHHELNRTLCASAHSAEANEITLEGDVSQVVGVMDGALDRMG